MLSISKPLSAGQAQTYHKREFASEKQNYWSQDQQGHSEWQGRLAGEWSLSGAVGAEHFARLSEGQHPHTKEQLVRHQVSKTYEGKNGKEITTVEHRAGWDATFSAPKSVSLTALVGGDERVREAHRESVRVALSELERYTEARIGNIRAPEPTGKFAAATFEHDTARPVEGYAAPQLHTHAVLFNVTERENGETRALQPQQLFASQSYATQVYRSELAVRLKELGYTVERGEYGQPEIKGYTKEYLEASSPRREQVKDHMRAEGLDGPAAAQIAAHRTRDAKEQLPAAEVLRQHRELAAQYGNQADRVVSQAQEHAQQRQQAPEKIAQTAVTYARDHLFERTAVESERSILTAALDRSMGEATLSQVRQEFDRRVRTGEFRAIKHGPAARHGHEGPQYTTAETLRMEREILEHMRAGNRRGYSDPMLVSPGIRIATEDRHPELNQAQRRRWTRSSSAARRSSASMAWPGQGRRRPLPSSGKASSGADTRWRDWRRPVAQRRSWARPAWRPRPCRRILPKGSAWIQESAGFTLWTKAHLLPPGKCMRSSSGSIRTTACSWSAIRASMSRSKPDASSRRCRSRA
jgi:conjugative relaxase-like TrwC/TraI family protein